MLRWPLVATLAPCACFTYPCDTDVLACEKGDEFVIDRSCVAQGRLGVALRNSGELQALPTDGWPALHHGVQGGIHYALGLDLSGLDEQHRQFRIEVVIRDCDAPCTGMDVLAERALVVDETWLDTDGDRLRLDDVIVLLERKPRAVRELEIVVTDSCGRQASTVRARAAG